MKTQNYDRGETWDQFAACAELMHGDPVTFDEYFYPESFRDRAVTRMAKRICAACPVQVECLQDALVHDDQYGVKGGTTPSERTNLLHIPKQRGPEDAA